MNGKTMHVTALSDFEIPGMPVFRKSQEYVIMEETAKELLRRGLVEVTVIEVKNLQPEKLKKSSKRTAK